MYRTRPYDHGNHDALRRHPGRVARTGASGLDWQPGCRPPAAICARSRLDLAGTKADYTIFKDRVCARRRLVPPRIRPTQAPSPRPPQRHRASRTPSGRREARSCRTEGRLVAHRARRRRREPHQRRGALPAHVASSPGGRRRRTPAPTTASTSTPAPRGEAPGTRGAAVRSTTAKHRSAPQPGRSRRAGARACGPTPTRWRSDPLQGGASPITRPRAR